MRFSFLAMAFTAIAGALAAEEDAPGPAVKFHSNDKDAPQHPPSEQITKFELSYVLEQYPDVEPQQMVELLTTKPLEILYTLVNNEEKDMSVVGIGGHFIDPKTGEITVNQTANSIGPIVIKPGTSDIFRQKINLDMDAGNYVLSPSVFIAYDDDLKVMQARSQLLTVVEDPISFFDPQLLLLEIILVAFVAAALYFYNPKILQDYFKGTAPVKVPVTAKGTSTGYDPNWIPKTHLKEKKQPKARKAY